MQTSDTPLVLVVDDNDSIRDSLAAAFEAKRYRSVGAPDGEQALEMVRAGNCPAIAIIAYHLPGATGADTTRCIKLLCPRIMVVAISKEHSRQGEMLAAGADVFLAKPFNVRELMDKVSQRIGEGSAA